MYSDITIYIFKQTPDLKQNTYSTVSFSAYYDVSVQLFEVLQIMTHKTHFCIYNASLLLVSPKTTTVPKNKTK